MGPRCGQIAQHRDLGRPSFLGGSNRILGFRQAAIDSGKGPDGQQSPRRVLLEADGRRPSVDAASTGGAVG
jgi:hypothetical protein